jgi:hypothetical protein
MSIIQGTAVTGAGDQQYQISRSLRFNSTDSAYLNRTPASAGNRKTWTWSAWLKRTSKIGSFEWIFCSNPSGSTTDTTKIGFNGSNYIAIFSNSGLDLATVAVFRDPSAWYHVVVKCDTTQATSSNRLAIYVNGVAQTLSGTYPTLNEDTFINLNQLHTFGRAEFPGFPEYIAEYVAEVHLIDGSALDPTSFGEFNSDTGVWEPIEYTGTYGTNGFYLPFSDNASTTTLGDDFSGNGNDWTPNNFSVTAGAGNDSLVDSPTRYGTDTGAGGEVRGNYCTANPLNKSANTVITNGNLDVSSPSDGDDDRVSGTLGVSSGKWYFEATRTDAVGIGNQVALGVMNSASPLSTGQYSGNPTNSGATANEWALTDRGVACNNTTYTNLSSTIGTIDQNDVIQVCIDMDAKKIWFGIANTFSGSPSAGTGEAFSNLPDSVMPLMYAYDGAMSMNFGQRPFAYTAPSGFKALVTTNLPAPTIADGGEYFNTVLWTGDGNNPRTVTGVGFDPDFVWIKSRSLATSHLLNDVIRGGNASLFSESTAGETANNGGGYLSAFATDGFTVTAGGSGDNAVNNTSDTYVGWNWKANGAGVSNTDGTITSTVSVNTTSGFSIVTYTGNGTAGATVGHGLGATPFMMIVKKRSATPSPEPWAVYHASLGATKGIYLNTTGTPFTLDIYWDDTAPTSSVFSIGDWDGINTSSQPYVAYCFAPVAGYSAFGSYTGNGSADGPFVFTGFRPAYAIFKSTTTTTGWFIWDSVTNTFNVMTKYLEANSSNAEGTYTGIDFLSNGFKFRSSSAGDGFNQSGQTYIYACFAENPFAYSLAR